MLYPEGCSMDRENLWTLFRATGMPTAYLLYQLMTEDGQDG